AIAATRANAYTRYTLMSLTRCLLEFADAEFTRDNAESVARARTLYETALELLDEVALKQSPNPCDQLIAQLDALERDRIQTEAPAWLPVWTGITRDLARAPYASAL